MISAVIITYNEAKNITRCLDSLQGVADEIIIVDAYSEDETEALCKSFSVRFIQQDWKGYASAKNFGNSLATCPYILSIDADEALSEPLKQSLSALKPLESQQAYSFARSNIYCGQAIRYCGWYPDVKVRLFPRGKARWEGDFVHETLQLDPGLTIQRLPGDLLHYTCYTIEEHVARINRYSTLAAADAFKRGKKASLLKLWLSAPARFWQIYVLKGGFLDGFYGYVIARLSAKSTFLRYAKLRNHWKNRGSDGL